MGRGSQAHGMVIHPLACVTNCVTKVPAVDPEQSRTELAQPSRLYRDHYAWLAKSATAWWGLNVVAQ
jgi:hypothetical protein